MTVVAMPTRQEKQVEVYTVRWLLEQKFPPPRWAIESILPEGLTLLVSPPKLGKSWMALAASVSVAFGGVAMGRYRCAGGPVLYLDLEQSVRRTQKRVTSMVRSNGQQDFPDGLHFSNRWPKVKDGGIEHLAEWLKGEPETRLVVVDTIAKIWPSNPGSGARQNAYYAEYEQLSQLKQIADDAGMSILLLHHQNKTTPADPLDRISGTSAFPGVADAVWILERERGRDTGALYVTGREVEDRKLELRFDPLTLQWIVTRDPKDGEQWR